MWELPEIKNKTFVFGAVMLLGLCAFAWTNFAQTGVAPGFYFLDVGQGDSELAVMRSGEKILTDAGPGKAVVESLARVLPPGEKYIDIVLITHPELDHYGGLRYVLDSYEVGAILWNGRVPQVPSSAWADIISKIKQKNIPTFSILKGDFVKLGADQIEILSPSRQLLLSSKSENEAALVEKIHIGSASALLLADIGKKTEDAIYLSGLNLKADILKVAHHGSKYSVNPAFLRAVLPSLAVIEVGKNSYGHPTKEVLNGLLAESIGILRTDIFGTVSAVLNGDMLDISTEKGGSALVN